ncbi:DUF58 domain-containing protein [Janibacter sp. G56]|uniref:DUF58 domain-containing protein n=1 Tax=Janibacter sp. G56 TaxID=3418717 RepID=UPI003D02E2AE
MSRLTDVMTTRGRSLLAAGIALVACGVLLGYVDLTRLGVLLVALPALSALLTRRHPLDLIVERRIVPSRIQIDEVADVTLTIENGSSRTSPLMLAEEQVDYALGDRPRFVLPRMSRGEARTLHYRVRSHARGRHRLGPLAVRVKDPFELTTRATTLSGGDEVIVLPRAVPLGGGPPASGTGGEGEVPHMAALHGEDDIAIREFRDGDDLRRIHWPSTARTGEMMVRQEDRPARRRAIVLLDTSSDVHAGTGTAGSFEWAVTAAASVCAHLIEHGYAVHLVTPDTAAVSSEPVTLVTALDVLAVMAPTDPDRFDEALRASAQLSDSGGIVVAIIGELDESRAFGLLSSRTAGATGMALIIDRDSYRHQPSGATRTRPDILAMDLLAAGWTATPVRSGTSVAEAWQQLRTGAGVRR